MKKFRYIFCIILALIQIYIPVSSFAGMNAHIDSDTDYVSVSGSYESMAGKRVTVQILAPGAVPDDIFMLGDKSFEEIFANVFEVVADKKGNFELPAFKLVASGCYGARVTYAGAEEEPVYVADLFRYFTPQDKELVDGYLKNSDADGLFAFVDGHSELFFANPDLYEACTDQDRKDIVTSAMNMTDGASYEKFGQNLARVCALYFAGQSEDDAYESFIKFYDDACFDKDYTPFANSSDYLSEDTLEEIIIKNCKGDSWKKPEQTLGNICDEIILSAIKKAVNQSFVERILTDNEEYLDINLANYKKLSDKRSVNKGLIEFNAKTISSLKDEFYDLVADAKKPKDSGSSGGGSSAPQKGNNVSVNVSGNSPVPVVPQPDQSGNTAVFTDMNGYEWAEEAVYALCEKGIVNGVSSNLFAPSNYVTREEFTKMFVGAIYGEVADSSSAFEDVTKGSWYEKYVAAGYNNGLINGVSSNLFGVGMNITRQDIATIIYRANPEAFANASKGISAKDAQSIADYARDAVEALSSAGIVNGYDDGTFRPVAFATRAEAAVIIYRYLNFAERG